MIYLCIQYTITQYCCAGFPHSDISGSKHICCSPKLIAAYRVLHRLSVPRHSPCALVRLNFLFLVPYVSSQIELFSLHCSRFSLRITLPVLLFERLYSFCLFAFVVSRFVYFSLFSFQGTFFLCASLLQVALVGSSGFEPPTLRLSGARSNHLSYEPLFSWSLVPFQGVHLVEMRGFEPLTPCLQGRCSPS